MKRQHFLTYITLVLISLFCVLSSQAQRIKGNGNVQKQTRTVSQFDKIKIGGLFNTYLSQGEKQSVVVEADSNLLPIIKTEVKDKKLIISLKGRSIKRSTKMNIYITLKDLRELSFSGVGNVICKTDLNLTNIKIIKSGVGNINLKGTASSATMINSGVGNINAFDFVVKNLTIKNKGVGNVEINSTETLDISNSGMGTIAYKGGASIKNLNSKGIGKIVKK